jgi:predicted N-acyltransferase
MLSIKTFNSITEIPSSDWDAANADNDYFKSHEFIKIIEESNIENSNFWYIMVFENNEIIGAAVFSSFIVSLDLFLDENGKKAVKLIRKLFPNFLRIRFLFCGIPISLGKDAILIKIAKYTNAILEAIVNESKIIAKTNKIKITNFKEFYLNEKTGFNHLLSLGFIKSWSIPYVDFYNKYENFTTYLQALRHSFRRQIKSNMSKVNFEAVGIKQEKLDTNHAVIEVISPCDADANTTYEQYINIMSRAGSVLEFLNLEFFENFLKNTKQSKILILRKDSIIIGNAILVEEGNKLSFMLIGIREEFRDTYASYFNILNAVIAYGIHNKFAKIGMGQTSYYVKTRMGGQLAPMVTYNFSSNKLINSILKVFNKLIFPEVIPQQYKVFKHTEYNL